jgi:hypothetical protein
MQIIFTLRKLGSFEFVFTLGLIFVLAFIFLIYLGQTMDKAKVAVLVSELRNMRIALNLYRGFNSKYPQDLRDLITTEIYGTKFIHEIYKRPYLEHQRTDKEGFPVDPWNRRFAYDPITGRINSRTKGYEKL